MCMLLFFEIRVCLCDTISCFCGTLTSIIDMEKQFDYNSCVSRLCSRLSSEISNNNTIIFGWVWLITQWGLHASTIQLQSRRVLHTLEEISVTDNTTKSCPICRKSRQVGNTEWPLALLQNKQCSVFA